MSTLPPVPAVPPIGAGATAGASGPTPDDAGAGTGNTRGTLPGARLTLTVAAVARRLGVAPATLRTWDRRYGLGPSEHTAGEHRRYSATDIARLVVMRRLTLEGLPPAEAAGIAATTAVADGGFALAEVATIPAAVVQAAMTDAAAVVGPDTEFGRSGGADLEGPRHPGWQPRPTAGPGEPPDRGVVQEQREVLARLGAARAWDEVLSAHVADGGPGAAAEVDAALRDAPILQGPRAVLVVGPASPASKAAAVALGELGLAARCAGVGAPGRMLAAAVRRCAPPAVLLHAETAADVPPHDGLLSLLAVRPAPLVVLSGAGWSDATVAAATFTAAGAGAVRADGLSEAVARCASAVRA